jgi:hypothetical protein
LLKRYFVVHLIKQTYFVVVLSRAQLAQEAARSIGVTQNTLLSWMKVPEFQKDYREARRAAFGQAIARLSKQHRLRRLRF